MAHENYFFLVFGPQHQKGCRPLLYDNGDELVQKPFFTRNLIIFISNSVTQSNNII